jgi:transcriptional regulator with PAS, ATPase and Fis domain
MMFQRESGREAKRATIAFLALDASMLELARTTLEGRHDDVRLARGLMGDAVATARQLSAEGVEVFISRGATAKFVASALPDVSVVDISTSALDLLTAIHKARALAKRVAVIAFPPMSTGAVEIGRVLGVSVAVHEVDREEDIAPAVIQARKDGAGVVVGGYITVAVAERLGMSCQPVETVAQSIVSAVEEARRIVHARAVERAKGQLLRTVLTSADNGIVAVDRDGLVTVINPRAARMLRVGEDDVIGRPIAGIWPRLALEKVVACGAGEEGRIERLFDQDLMCDTIPITVGAETVGAVATFHDVRRIQRMEATVRTRILAAGHVATARFADILGSSPALRQAISMAGDFALTHATVMIQGVTGTGKELFAQGIHNASARHEGPFVAVNCAALPGQLLESELFGYVQGAFTGASQKGKAGLFELAHGGTIFLDEIAEMEPTTQGKLLRVLQEKKVMRLGSDQVIPVDVRVLAATNKNLRRLVGNGAFRDDLYYRLNVLQLRLPALRNRKEDIALLAETFLRQARGGASVPVLSGAALRELERHDWPGNVRELQNVMARVAATSRAKTVSGTLIAQLIEDAAAGRLVAGVPSEAERIAGALSQAGGRVAEAARMLGISRSTLWRRTRLRD